MKSNMAGALLDAGEDERAAQLLTEALDGHRAVGDMYGVSSALTDKAMVALRRDDPESAAGDLREALSLSRSIGDTQTVAHALAVVVAAVSARGDPYAAVTLAAADDAFCAAHRFELGSLEREFVDRATQEAVVRSTKSSSRRGERAPSSTSTQPSSWR